MCCVLFYPEKGVFDIDHRCCANVFLISSPGAVFTIENHTLAIISFYFRVMAVCSAERKKRG